MTPHELTAGEQVVGWAIILIPLGIGWLILKIIGYTTRDIGPDR